MDSDKRSIQVERLEVGDTSRRHRWFEDKKLKIVLESLKAPHHVAATARRYGVRSLPLRRRRLFAPIRRMPPNSKSAVSQRGWSRNRGGRLFKLGRPVAG